jgi:alpha-beta hydrolase superfamily lysophospholipase
MEALVARDGTALRLRRWPTTGAARGTLHLVHGLGEHSGRYEDLAQVLNGAGWHVAGLDLRGHGESAGARGGIPDAQALLSDLAVAIDHLRGSGAPSPQVLLGHSMGGLIAARFVAAELLGPAPAWFRRVDGLVLSSPALDPGLNTFQRALLKTLAPVAPRLAVGNGLKPEWICRDPEVVRRYAQDPLVHDRVTPRLVRFIVEAGRQVTGCAPRWKLPTLLMWAEADRCVSPAGSAAFAAAAPPDIVARKPWPGLFHELFNEPEREQVTTQLLQWLGRY